MLLLCRLPARPGLFCSAFIEFQFNQANASTSLAAIASLDNFVSTGFTFNDPSNFSQGGVTGSLTSLPLVFDNTVGGSNLFDQAVTSFGTLLSFNLTLSGDALVTPANDGSQFFIFLQATDHSNLIGPPDGVGSLIINGDTTVTLSPVINISTITPATSAPVGAPEPSTILLFSGSLAAWAIWRRAASR